MEDLYLDHMHTSQEDLPYWLKLADGTSHPILELGCGAGRVLLSLVEAGHTVWGLDNDPAVLARLQARTPVRWRSRVHVQQGDMTAFELPQRFGLILLPCNTYSMLKPDDRPLVLKAALAHLLPGATLAISIPAPDLLESLPRSSRAEVEEHFIHPHTGNPVQVSSAFRKRSGRFELTWIYDHLQPDGTTQRQERQFVHYLSSLETYETEMLSAGYRIRAAHGDFDGSPYDPESSSYLIFQLTPGQ